MTNTLRNQYRIIELRFRLLKAMGYRIEMTKDSGYFTVFLFSSLSGRFVSRLFQVEMLFVHSCIEDIVKEMNEMVMNEL